MAEKFLANDYVYRLFKDGQAYIDDSIDPLCQGLIDAMGCLERKLHPDTDLPPELVPRYQKWMADAHSAKAEQPSRNLLQTTIYKSRNKKRWRLASELLHLRYALRQFMPLEERARAVEGPVQ